MNPVNLMNIFWDVVMTYLIGAIYLLRQLCNKHIAPKGLKLRKNKVAIVTGGNRGIGLEVVKQLLALEMHVIIACRNPDNCEKTVRVLKNNYPSAKVETMQLDLSSLNSVRKFAHNFVRTSLPLHLLINNAGVMIVPLGKTEDGFEHHFGVNYLGHFLLTQLLLPTLTASGNVENRSRVINVSSCIAFIANINFSDLQFKKAYSPWACYAQSKLAQIMFTWSLQEKLAAENAFVTVNSLHPGIVFSELYDNIWLAQLFPFILKTLYKTPQQGADAIVYCALDEASHNRSPCYYENCEDVDPPKLLANTAARQRLWDESWRMVGLN